MSEERRHFVIYEQRDGTFCIPQKQHQEMGSRVEPLMKNAGLTISPHFDTSRQQYDDVELLRYENNVYKRKYLQCLTQLQELVELHRQISNKLDLAILNIQLGITLAPNTPSQRPFGVERTQLMTMDRVQTRVTDMPSSSGGAAEGPKIANSMVFPNKKRQRPE